jgi:hypothetical protein
LIKTDGDHSGGDKLVGHILHLVSVETKNGNGKKTQSNGSGSGGNVQADMVGFVDLKMRSGKGVRLEGRNAEEVCGEIKEKLEVCMRRVVRVHV